jgi:hypothetical protein
MVISTVIDHGLDPWSGKIKDYKIGIYCFSTVNIAFSSKDRLAGSELGYSIKQ